MMLRRARLLASSRLPLLPCPRPGPEIKTFCELQQCLLPATSVSPFLGNLYDGDPLSSQLRHYGLPRLTPPNKLLWIRVDPLRKIVNQEAFRKFATASDDGTRQTGTSTPPQSKGSSNLMVKVGIGSAALLAVVTTYLVVEKPESIKFVREFLTQKPSDFFSASKFKNDKGDAVELTDGNYKNEELNKDNSLNVGDGASDPVHVENKHFKESDKGAVEDDSTISQTLSPEADQFAQDEVPPSQEGDAHTSTDTPKNTSDAERAEKYTSISEVIHHEVLKSGDGAAVTVKGDERETTEANNASDSDLLAAHSLEESSLPSDKKVDSGDDTLAKDLEKVGMTFSFVEVLHAAEKRQADADARVYNEAKKRLKDKYEEELKDARAKELMYAEEVSRLEKELAKEKARASATLKLQQEEAAERLHKELKHKEEAAEMKLNKTQLLAKAQMAAAVVQEKEAHLRKLKDVMLEIDALHLAFHAHSEEARQSHTVHKLAVGTFALEDAMMRGAPIGKEIVLLFQSVGGYGSDPLLDVTIASLPDESIKEGTKTRTELHLRFEYLSRALRELSVIPNGGGGLFTHAFARVVSVLKVKENGEYSDGIEAVISKVERYLGEGKLADAADSLEKGVQGTKAEDLAAEWVRLARNRAVMEQALSVLHAHTTAIASSLA